MITLGHILKIFWLLLVSAIMIPLASTATQTQSCGRFYLLQTEAGDSYGIVGMDGNDLVNGTKGTVVGQLAPYDSSVYLNPDPHFKGTVFIQALQVGTMTYSFARTVVIQTGNSSITTTQALSYPPTYRNVTLTGSLIFHCAATARPAATQQTPTGPQPTNVQSINIHSGTQTVVLVVLFVAGLGAVASVLFVRHRQRNSSRDSTR
jgi:hypothetical protein